MSDSGDENDNNVARLPAKTKPKAAPHLFGEARRKLPSETLSGLEQVERTCAACGLVKITIMRGAGERAYRWGDARYQFNDGFEPECAPCVDIVRGREAAE